MRFRLNCLQDESLFRISCVVEQDRGGIDHPNARPYETVRRALGDAVERSARMSHSAKIRPYLQSFSIFRVRYTAEDVRAQIRATEELGLTDWVLWNSSGNYPVAAFRPSTHSPVPVAAGPATSQR